MSASHDISDSSNWMCLLNICAILKKNNINGRPTLNGIHMNYTFARQVKMYTVRNVSKMDLSRCPSQRISPGFCVIQDGQWLHIMYCMIIPFLSQRPVPYFSLLLCVWLPLRLCGTYIQFSSQMSDQLKHASFIASVCHVFPLMKHFYVHNASNSTESTHWPRPCRNDPCEFISL